MNATLARQGSRDLPFNILTDLPSAEDWLQRADETRHKRPEIDDLLTMIEGRYIKGEHGDKIALPANATTLEQAALFLYLMAQLKPILTVETGFHNGLMAGVLTAAHMLNGLNGGHIPVQDKAKQTEEGVGFYTLQRLNLTGYQIMEHEPAVVLPQIYLQKLNDGLKLVYFNSAENYEEQMMEYFYLNLLLNEGGVMAINLGSPARRRLLDHIRQERHDYAIRELECGIALVQKPAITALAKYDSGLKH